MRGGLDDALDKLARREEVRRRAAGEATGTSPAVTELVEAIAGVVARHPELGVTVGAEGSGDPILLHFHFAEGQVQVTADNAVPRPEAAPAARHADFDFDVELDEPAAPEQYPGSPAPPPADHRRTSQDDHDRYGPPSYGYPEQAAPQDGYYADSDTAERRYGSFDSPPAAGYEAPPAEQRYPSRDPGETSRDLGARMRDLGMASRSQTAPEYPPHPFAATPPPPVPPEALYDPTEQTTRRIRAEQHNGPTERIPAQPQRGGSMPSPLPKPIPLQVERPEETEQAARRLAALLRDDPSLLNQAPRE